MATFSVSVDIPSPPSRVYDVIVDVDRWHEWTPSITRVKRLKDVPLAVGSRVLIRQPKLPPAFWKVTALEPGRGFTWVSPGPGFRVSGRHYVEASEAGSTATLAVDIEGPLANLWAKLTRTITERYIGDEAAGLKARSADPAYRRA